jgi:hypothetical protein
MIAFAMAVVIAPNAQAATAEELAAQISALQSQLASLQGQLGGTTTTTTTSTTTSVAACAGVTFTRNLTLGSTGTDVKCLQALLNSAADTAVATTGVGSAGNETEYFGGLTKTAVIKFQNKFAAEVLTPVGLTAGTGFVGAQTRVKLNAMLAGTSTTTTGTTTGTTTTTTTTTTSGKEGEFSATLSSTPATGQDAEEGETGVAVMGIKIKATGSAIDIQRVTLKFDAKPYKYFDKVALYDGSTVVAEADLDADSVSKVDSTDYRITLANFENKFTVAENATKTMTVKVDVVDNMDEDYLDDTVNISLATDSAIRGVDEAGLNQYGGDTDITRRIDMAESATEDATLTVTSNDDTPLDRNVIADTDKEISDATLLVFDVEAKDDDITITDMNDIAIDASYATSTVDTVYLYNDSNEVIGESDVEDGTVSFTDLDETVKDGDTATFTLKFDKDIDADDSFQAGETVSATVDAATNIVAEGSDGDELDDTQYDGSAEGNLAYLYEVGPIFTISTISTSTKAATDSTDEAISATFKVVVEAQGDDVFLVKNGSDSAFDIQYTLDDGASSATGVSLTYTKPSGTTEVTGDGGTFYKVSEGDSITFSVAATKVVGTAGYYDLRMEGINWATSEDEDFDQYTSVYMADQSDWISDAEYLQ